MVGSVVADDVEAEPVVVLRAADGLHLAGQQIDLGRRLGLVRVVDLEVALLDLALPLLPDVPQPALRPLVQVSGLPAAQGGIALGLVDVVLPADGGTPPVLEKTKNKKTLYICFPYFALNFCIFLSKADGRNERNDRRMTL